jgi:hypothetical protein
MDFTERPDRSHMAKSFKAPMFSFWGVVGSGLDAQNLKNAWNSRGQWSHAPFSNIDFCLDSSKYCATDAIDTYLTKKKILEKNPVNLLHRPLVETYCGMCCSYAQTTQHTSQKPYLPIPMRLEIGETAHLLQMNLSALCMRFG